MVMLQDLKRISDYEWEIPQSFRSDMRVPVRLFASRDILKEAMRDKSLEQAVNAATLPGLVGCVLVMPDMHQGYGFPIGGVAATKLPDGVISPGGIGYDINCGVRLLASQLDADQVSDHLDVLATSLNQHCPSGVGEKGVVRLSDAELEGVCRDGSLWAFKQGYATEADLRRTEEGGRLEGADPSKVSHRARERGRPQLGSLGAGNHFIEVDVVDQVFDARSAQIMGLAEGCVVVQIHCGSRGFGHQICTDYVEEFQGAVKRYNIHLPDRELVCAPLNSPEGQNYLAAMRCAANYAFANRQILAHSARRAFEEVLAGKVKNWHLHQVYDIAHNMGKIETHTIDGQPLKVCVHRKGATRAFGPGSPELPEEYRPIGQPVLVPGSMGTASWVLVGTEKSMALSFGSSCHGAGRTMSRHEAKHAVRGEKLRNELEAIGIKVRAGSMAGLAEEAPQAYKDVDTVVESVVGAGIARKVARLRPLAVIKG
jgi:tRNA-splicing ligase RtcB